MNLYFLAQKKDPNLVLAPTATPAVRKVNGVTWRGLDLAPGPDPQIVIKGATRFSPFRERPETIGWWGTAVRDKGKAYFSFGPSRSETDRAAPALQGFDGHLAPIIMPWKLTAAAQAQVQDLTIHVPQDSGPVFLAIHKSLDRKSLIALCKGRGVELGPGPKPQVLPATDVDVSYIEQMPPEEWKRLYANKDDVIDETLWRHYRVGDAHDLPVEDESLDFIFSSHVFEHLANPLRHLELWRAKLRDGGRVVGVVPDYIGSKDYLAEPSELVNLIAEYQTGSLSPTRDHYRRYAEIRNIADGGDAMWENQRSIHVHFYSNANMAHVLRHACEALGYSGFQILHTPNHKDFHFVLTR